MSRDLVCLECPLPDCRPHDPGCLLSPKHNPNKGEEQIHPSAGPLDIGETASRLKCSTDWLRKEIRKLKNGHVANLPRFFMVGNRYRWEPEDIEFWIQANKKGGSV